MRTNNIRINYNYCIYYFFFDIIIVIYFLLIYGEVVKNV